MTITKEAPHRRYGTGYGVCFWRGNTASNENEANKAVVYAGPPGMPYPEFEFELPAERGKMQALEQALQKAFQSGSYAAKQEIRLALGLGPNPLA